ncbi:MAG: glycosyltransferase family 39 protein [Candidatus Coatesbacteria bacterium]|nr:MAG: glycosyltransferase family 39 protein [Candidatus Coatesbacteria bacterium]
MTPSRADRKNPRGWLLPAGFFCAALLARAAYAVAAPRALEADAVYYYETARNLALGVGYVLPDGRLLGSVPPVFPYFLAGVFKIFGAAPASAVAAQVLVGAATAVVVYFTARVYFDGRVAAWAAALFAVYPFYIWASSVVLTEALTTLLLAASLWVYYYAARGSALAGAGAGLLLAATALCRSSFLAVGVPLVVALAFFRAGGWRTRLRVVAAAAVAFAALTGMWAYRNYRLLGVPTPATLNGARIFYEGNFRAGEGAHPSSVELMRSPEFEREARVYLGTPCADVAYERFFRARAGELWRREAGAILTSLPGKFVRLCRPAPDLRLPARLPLTAAAGALLVFAWVGILRYRRPAGRAFVLLAPVLITLVTHAVLKPLFRFRLPVDFILIIFAAAFASFCWEQIRGDRRRR